MNIIPRCVEYLKIEKPYIIRLNSRHKKTLQGYYTAEIRGKKLIQHRIMLYLPTIAEQNSNIESVISHEFVHAWQQEKGILNEKNFHDNKFQRKALELQHYLRAHGFSLFNLYDPKVDV